MHLFAQYCESAGRTGAAAPAGAFIAFCALYGLFRILGAATGRGAALSLGASGGMALVLILLFHDTEVLKSAFAVIRNIGTAAAPVSGIPGGAGLPEASASAPGLLGGIGFPAAAAFLWYMALCYLTRTPAGFRVLIPAADLALILVSVLYAGPDRMTAASFLLLNLLWFLGLRDEIPGRWLIPLAGVICAALLFPGRDEPIDWNKAVRKVQGVLTRAGEAFSDGRYALSGLGGSDEYESGYSGFVQPGGAGAEGAARRNELYLWSASGGVRYLTGRILIDPPGMEPAAKDTGNSGMGTGGDMPGGAQPDPDAEDLEARWFAGYLQAMMNCGVTKEEAALWSEKREIQIEFGYLRTRDVIRPGGFLYPDRQVASQLDGGSFARTRKKGFHYGMTGIAMDYGSPYLQELIRGISSGNGAPDERKGQNGTAEQAGSDAAIRPDYASMKELARTLYSVPLESVISRKEYEQWLHQPEDLSAYLRTDDLVTDRMRVLAGQLGAAAQSDYDVCRAVEEYLRQYRYDPSADLGREKSYIDTFLFSAGTGRCVHYASAMVMLLRLQGIPARCVVGYRVRLPSKGTEEYPVTGSCAHMWPEAWIEGFGWVPFEPTAGVSSLQEASWGRVKQETGTDDPEEHEDSGQSLRPEVPALPVSYVTEETDPELEKALQRERRLHLAQIVFGVALAAAAGAVLCVCLLFAALILIRRRNYRRADREERFLRDFRDIRSLLGTMFGPGQIPEDYEKPLREKSAADADLLHLVTGAYNRRRFSRDGAALTPEEGDAAVRLREELLRTVTSGSRHPKLAALRFEAEWEKK